MPNRKLVKALNNGRVEVVPIGAVKNSLTYKFYQSQLRAIGAVRVEWTGLPENIDEFYVGQKLLETDMCYFRDEVLNKEYILPVSEVGVEDVQGIPQTWKVTGANGYTNSFTPENAVIIRCTPCTVEGVIMRPIDMIDLYAEKLTAVDRAIAVNIKKQKTPWLLAGDQKQKGTLEKIFCDIETLDEDKPFVLVDTDMNELIKVLNTVAPLVVPQLYEYKKQLWQEALGFLGVTNTSIEKKERLTTSEVEANNDGTVMMRYLILAPYQSAVKKINKMFNRDITVNFRNNVGANLDGTSKIEEETESEEDKDVAN